MQVWKTWVYRTFFWVPPFDNLPLRQNVKRSTSIKKRLDPNAEEQGNWNDPEDIEDIPNSNFEILETSLPGRLDGQYFLS